MGKKRTDARNKLSEVSRVMSEMGRRGGKIGGKRRLETMTDEQRSHSAYIAAKARWSKRKSRDMLLDALTKHFAKMPEKEAMERMRKLARSLSN